MMIENDFSLLNLVPTVLRARDYRLYTDGARRLVDLWQNGGAAILGHTPPSVLREIKNTASRGLYAPFPHFLEKRYLKALSRILPGRVFRLYAAPPQEIAAYFSRREARSVEPKVRGSLMQSLIFWRPFADPAGPFFVPKDVPVLIPVVPGIQGWREYLPDGMLPDCDLPGVSMPGVKMPLGLCVLAVDPNSEEAQAFPPGDFLPPVLLAAAARGIYDMIAAAPERANPVYPRIAKALKNSRPGAVQWRRRGVYLSLDQALSPPEWAALFRRFLDAGFLLPPVQSHPLILPGVLSGGEEAKLAQLLAE